jgi:tetratricopeptide (TPR) repeat protein
VLDISIKAAAVCMIAGFATLLLRRSSAYARSMVWVFSLAVLLALPLAQLVPPIWNLPVLPEVGGWFRQGAETRAITLQGDKAIDAQDGSAAGAKPSDYALFLMDIAADLGTPRGPVWQLSTISQGSNLKERIMCILDPKIDRTRGRRRTGIVSCFVVASIILPLSISGIWQTQAQENHNSQKEMELKKKEMQLKKEMELQKKMSLENLSDEEKAKIKEEQAFKEKMASLSPEERIKLQWEKISQSENSAAVLVHDAIVKKGPDAGIKTALKLKESGDDTYYFKEGEFNVLGYLFLFGGDVDEALAVFKLNVKMNPESWNVCDSFAEGFLAAGKYDEARKYYEKSLVLNPENENGTKMLAKIEKLESGEEHASSKKHKSNEEHKSSE